MALEERFFPFFLLFFSLYFSPASESIHHQLLKSSPQELKQLQLQRSAEMERCADEDGCGIGSI